MICPKIKLGMSHTARIPMALFYSIKSAIWRCALVPAPGIIASMTATIAVARAATTGEMRPLNILRDLPAVADLIEVCFAATMDAEGRSYVDQMRRNGRDSSFIGWASKVIDSTSLPLSGFVWEDNGRIVG